MYIVLYRKGDYTRVLGLYDSYNEALGNAYSFTRSILSSWSSSPALNVHCDFDLHKVEPSGEEFLIYFDNGKISHIQILEEDR